MCQRRSRAAEGPTTHARDPPMNRLPAAERGITIADFLIPIRVGERMSARFRHLALICVGAAFIALTANVDGVAAGQPRPDHRADPVRPAGWRRPRSSPGGAVVAAVSGSRLLLPVYAGQSHGLSTIISLGSSGVVLGAPGGISSASSSPRPLSGGWPRWAGTATSAVPVGAMVLGEVPDLCRRRALAGRRRATSRRRQPVEKGLLPFVIGTHQARDRGRNLPVRVVLVGRRAGDR